MSVMSKIKLVDERNGKDFCLELDYKERCYIFTTARGIRKEDFLRLFVAIRRKFLLCCNVVQRTRIFRFF